MSLATQAAIVLGVTVLSVAFLWAARRSPYNERFATEVGEHNKAFDFLGTAFAVLLAFVVLEAYDSYNEGKRGAELEAQAVLELSRTAEAYEPEQNAMLKATLVCYGRAVVHQGWPAMRDESSSSVVNEWGRGHAVRNLFIIDGSIFVTAAAVTPTHTIQALALPIADTLKRNLANLVD